MTKISRCGTCYYGEFVPQDITRRICFGAPPTALQMPAPNGKVTFQMARPIVGVSDRACALYRGKDANDNARDDDALQQSELFKQ